MITAIESRPPDPVNICIVKGRRGGGIGHAKDTVFLHSAVSIVDEPVEAIICYISQREFGILGFTGCCINSGTVTIFPTIIFCIINRFGIVGGIVKDLTAHIPVVSFFVSVKFSSKGGVNGVTDDPGISFCAELRTVGVGIDGFQLTVVIVVKNQLAADTVVTIGVDFNSSVVACEIIIIVVSNSSGTFKVESTAARGGIPEEHTSGAADHTVIDNGTVEIQSVVDIDADGSIFTVDNIAEMDSCFGIDGTVVVNIKELSLSGSAGDPERTPVDKGDITGGIDHVIETGSFAADGENSVLFVDQTVGKKDLFTKNIKITPVDQIAEHGVFCAVIIFSSRVECHSTADLVDQSREGSSLCDLQGTAVDETAVINDSGNRGDKLAAVVDG